jgi:hypothetical protein
MISFVLSKSHFSMGKIGHCSARLPMIWPSRKVQPHIEWREWLGDVRCDVWMEKCWVHGRSSVKTSKNSCKMIIAYFKWRYHAIIGVTTYNWQRARTAVASEIGSQGDF